METAWNVLSIVVFFLLCFEGWRSFRRQEPQKYVLIGLALLALPIIDKAIGR